jgi:hypothetical protein
MAGRTNHNVPQERLTTPLTGSNESDIHQHIGG